ncbi:MAG: phosphodiester glycosidase family protein [Armatimonadota bacterium]
MPPLHVWGRYLCLIILFLPQTCHAETWTRELAAGVTLTQTVKRPDGSSAPTYVANVLTLAPGVKVEAALACGRVYGDDKSKGRESVSAIARRTGAVAAVNAGYFWQSGDPLGLHVSGGELISEPWPGRAAFGIARDGRFLFGNVDFEASVIRPDGRTIPVNGINRPRQTGELVVYTPRFHTRTLTNIPEAVVACDGPIRPGAPLTGTVTEVRHGPGPIPEKSIVLAGIETLQAGDRVSIIFHLKPAAWEGVTEAVGAGPWLVRCGKVYIDAAEESFKPDIAASTTSRTAVGATADGRLVIATIGAYRRSGGVKLAEMAEFMKSLGCTNAINLDGGGSATMANAFGVLNSPAEGIERAIASALVVTAPKTENSPALTINRIDGPIPSGATVPLTLLDAEGQPVPAEQAIWSATGGSFVDQSGLFHAILARPGSISATIGSATATIPVQVVPGAPDLSAKLESDSPNRSLLDISAADANRKPVPGYTLQISVTGGTPDSATACTDAKGNAVVGITWDSPGSTVEVWGEGLPPVRIERP